MQPHRPFLKCVAVWTSGAVLLLALYAGLAPFVCELIQQRIPAAGRVTFVYVPLIYWYQHPEVPGSGLYRSYWRDCSSWCEAEFGPG